MSKFLLDNYYLFTYSLEFLAAVTGILLYSKYKTTAAKYFVWFLFFIAISDLLSYYVRYVRLDEFLDFLIGTKFERNHWWGTIYWAIGAIMFFSFYYRQIFKTDIFRKVIKIASYSFLLFSILHIINNWDAFFNQFFIVIDILGALIIFLCTTFYFYEILQSEKILVFYRSLSFYISAVIFIWWLIITPLTFYDIYYEYEIGVGVYDKAFVNLRHLIILFANMFMYLTYTFALIWCKPENEL
ncbi:hypothetical protein ACKGJY_01160 [Hyunsoonleella sp. 2307UL5-6]|uniref:hypothetical protein n=1 Tax=Hyunsoonleella sp. 2307UL5-6 TaxID=3384768 RepID=UPI0039BD4D7E